MRQRMTLKSRITADGLDVINDDVPLGKVYYADLDGIKEGRWYNPRCGWKNRQTVPVADTANGPITGMFLLELLHVEANA